MQLYGHTWMSHSVTLYSDEFRGGALGHIYLKKTLENKQNGPKLKQFRAIILKIDSLKYMQLHISLLFFLNFFRPYLTEKMSLAEKRSAFPCSPGSLLFIPGFGVSVPRPHPLKKVLNTPPTLHQLWTWMNQCVDSMKLLIYCLAHKSHL